MKQLIYILLVLSFMLTSCSKDEEEEYYNPIEGEWRWDIPEGYDIITFTHDFKIYGKRYTHEGESTNTLDGIIYNYTITETSLNISNWDPLMYKTIESGDKIILKLDDADWFYWRYKNGDKLH